MRGLFEYPIGEVWNGVAVPSHQDRHSLPPAPSMLSKLGKQSLDEDRYLKELALDVNHYFYKLNTVSTLLYQPHHMIQFQSYYLQQIIMIQVSHTTGPQPPLLTAHDQSDRAQSGPPQPQHVTALVPRQPKVEPQQRPVPKTKLDAIFLLEVTMQRNIMILEDIESGLAKITDLSTKTIRCLRELKKQLLVYTTVLEKLLLSVTNIGNGFNQSDIPIEQVRECKKSVLDLFKKLSPEELHKVISPEAVATPDHVLCSIIGLSSSCAEYLHNIPDGIRNHQPDRYWIHRLLEDNWTNSVEQANDETMATDGATADCDFAFYKDLSANMSSTDSVSAYGTDMTDVQQQATQKRSRDKIQSGDRPKQIMMVEDPYSIAALEKMGFTPSRARLLCDRLSANTYKGSQTTLYWAKLYIDSAFEYDILLNSAPRYPYQPDKVGVEITEHLRVIDDDDDDDMITTKPVRMINFNTGKDPGFKCINNNYSKECEQNDENVLLFHATNHDHVQHILENGILPSNGAGNQDFSDGNGFYLSYTMEDAYHWAIHSRRFSPQAIIVYKVPKGNFQDFNCLNLSDKTTWERVVRYYRSGRSRALFKSSMKAYDRYDMIEGPMCRNSCSAAKIRSFNPEGFGRGKEQMCIKSESIAQQLGNFIDFVIFF